MGVPNMSGNWGVDGTETALDDSGSVRARRVRHNTVDKVMRLLEALAARPDGIGVRELARAVSIDKSAVSRLFEQLEELGVAVQDQASGQYRVGPTLFALAATIHGRDTLWQAAEPIVRRVATTFNETCYLAVRDGDEVIFREKVDCTHPLRYVIDPGERAPLHAGAGGRAVLLALTDDEVRGVLERTGLPAITPRTITKADKLIRLVRTDRQRGYASSRGERVPSGGAVAAPFLDATGRCVGSIVFTCPDARYDAAAEPDIASAVVEAASELSRRLGYPAAS